PALRWRPRWFRHPSRTTCRGAPAWRRVIPRPARPVPRRAWERKCGSIPRPVGSYDFLPAARQSQGAADHSHHAVGLRKIAPQLAARRLYVLGEQAQRIAPLEQAREALAGLVETPRRGECVDVPERANGEGVLRPTEIVGMLVAEQQVAGAQLLLDAFQRLQESRIGGRQQTELRQ